MVNNTMSKAKHTPGPWEAYRSTVPGPQEGMWQVAAIADGGDCVCDLWRLEESTHDAWELSEEDAEANARLIAAAPELLAAFEACRDAVLLDRDWDNHTINGVLEYLDHHFGDAIAKATGKENP